MDEPRRVHRAWGLLPLGAGVFFEVEAFRAPWAWTDALMAGFGLLLLATGVYTLATGIALSRWRG